MVADVCRKRFHPRLLEHLVGRVCGEWPGLVVEEPGGRCNVREKVKRSRDFLIVRMC